jgi:hypothetical protein
MKFRLILLVMAVLCLMIAACGPVPKTPAQPGVASVTPTPCATASAAGGTTTNPNGGTTVQIGTPAPGETPLTPAQLATLAAIESHTNPSGPTLPAGQPGTSTLPPCPTQPATAGASPTPCIAPNSQGAAGVTSSTVQTGPAQQTTPLAGQTPLTPAQIATLAANESRTNPSGPPLPTGQPNAPSLLPCPTATPAK